VVIDKGMNSESNYTWIDEHSRIHFVTNYSPYFSEELTSIPLSRFELLDIEKNRRLLDEGKPKEQIWSYRTEGEYWGKRRTVILTYNPATFRKQEYALAGKLKTLKQELLVMRAKFGKREPQWRKAGVVKERYVRLCERLHVSTDLYVLKFTKTESGAFMRFHRDVNRINRKRAMFGKHIIITDNHDWTTEEIVEANLDRWQVEEKFRLSKDDDLVGTRPIRHWTDSKIRCHLFTCVAAMTYLRLLELRLSRAGINRTAEDVMSDMRHLHSMLYLRAGDKSFKRCVEKPTKKQKEVLAAFGYVVTPDGVLQPLKR